MDRISTSLLDEFSADAHISGLDESQRFEHFAAFLTISRYVSDDLDTHDIVTGSGNDTGLDAVAIIVNGAMVSDPEEVQELADKNGYLDAAFAFVQAERSAGFEAAKIGTFGFGVQDFFSDKPKLPRNTAVIRAAKVMAAIYALSSKFKRGNPTCKLFYVTTGRVTTDAALEARRQAVVADLNQLDIFRDVEFTLLGADALQRLFNQTKNAVARDFTFAERTVAPEIPGVAEAYLGLLPAAEFIRLLDDEEGTILKTIFYDNVRDWQDYNEVNEGIRAALADHEQRTRFVLMNNGVTIIARTMRATGNRFHIEDYQIVNGCQTSHVLFDNRHLIDDTVFVPLRLISTHDENVIASIVKATNRQTEVKEEQLIALSDFQKRLEGYFQTFPQAQRLYYERRSRQYATAGVEKTRIVTPASLIRAYASIFSDEAHRTTRTYRLLLGQLGRSVFGADDQLEPYYYAASAIYRLDYLFRNGLLDSKYKPARYHILMAARILENPNRPPRSNSREMSRYAQALLETVWDAHKAEKLYTKAAELVAKAAGGDFDRDHIRTQPFTEEVRRLCMQEHA